MTLQITVLGLNQVGTSVGLALAEPKGQFLRVGNDRDADVARTVGKLGAFDQVLYNLPASVEKADLVILAMPVDEIRKTLEIIAQELKPGAVVIDTSPVKVQVMEWAKELIPAGRYFISMTPTLNPQYLESLATGVNAARPDLFKNSLMVITNPPGTDEGALEMTANLAGALGAAPLFADPWEADGLLAAAHLLPRLVAAALMNAAADQPGWTEGRKLAGKPFAAVTAPVLDLDESKALGQSALLNRENTLRVLDNLMGELETLRQALDSQDKETLANRLEHARQNRVEWWIQRTAANWGTQQEEPPLPTSGNFFARLVGLGKKKE